MVSRLIFNSELPSVDVFRPVQRLRSMGLYAGNLWKATRRIRRGERERDRDRGKEMERVIARETSTRGVRAGQGASGVDVEEEEENVCWRMSFAIEAAGYQGS